MSIQDFPHVVEPFDHQLDHLLNHCETEAWGLLWEQGTAKTKPVIDTTAYLYMEGKINGLLVVAPPGVERNWNTDEIPEHLPIEIALDTRTEVFYTAKKNTKYHKRAFEVLIRHEGLSIMLISYNAFMTKEGKDTVWKFLRRRRCMYALDESHNIKSPNAKRTKSIVASGRYAAYKRILTGTPIAVGPFDLYSQVRFLDEMFWKDRGIGGSVEFRNHFGEWFTAADCKRLHGYDPGFDKLLNYKNLDELKQWLGEISDRHTKDDVLDLPPKLYSKRYFDISKEQLAIYEELKDELFYEFGDGEVIDGELPIVRLLRFQQITSNYVPVGGDDDRSMRFIADKNPRLGAMEQIRDETHHPALVWARFVPDVDQLMDLLGDKAVRYDGSVTDDDAERAKAAFQAGDVKWFVGTAQKGGPGLTLHQAKTVVYYSNSFRLIDRLQSEDRAHRAGMDEHPVNYIDIVAGNVPVDWNIVHNLREKRDLASGIQGDELRDWI